jgi:hypothetical protein
VCERERERGEGFREQLSLPGTNDHACNPSYLGG